MVGGVRVTLALALAATAASAASDAATDAASRGVVAADLQRLERDLARLEHADVGTAHEAMLAADAPVRPDQPISDGGGSESSVSGKHSAPATAGDRLKAALNSARYTATRNLHAGDSVRLGAESAVHATALGNLEIPASVCEAGKTAPTLNAFVSNIMQETLRSAIVGPTLAVSRDVTSRLSRRPVGMRSAAQGRAPPPIPVTGVTSGAAYNYHRRCLAAGGLGCTFSDQCSGRPVASLCPGSASVKCCFAENAEPRDADVLIAEAPDATADATADAAAATDAAAAAAAVGSHPHIESVVSRLRPGSLISAEALRSGFRDIEHHIHGRWERTRDAPHIFAGTDVLYEAVEHQTTGAKVTAEGIDLSKLSLNPHLPKSTVGVTMSYGEVIGLAGDFYGRPDCSISVGPLGEATGASKQTGQPAAPTARDAYMRKIYDHCNWGDYSPVVDTPCPANSGDDDKEATKKRFSLSFATLYNLEPNARNNNMAGKRQLDEVRRLVNQERRWIGTGSSLSKSVRYISAGGVMITDYTLATGGEIANAPIVGRVPLGGLFMDLAGVNADHFSERGNSRKAYEAGHTLAIELAAAARRTGDAHMLQQAFLMDAFACHYLTDMFAAGHVRTQRWAMHEAARPANALGDMFSEQSHSEDNWYGLNLRSDAHPRGWYAQGDLLYFNDTNADNRNRIVEAVAASVAEVAYAHSEGGTFDSTMARFFPTVKSTETSKPLCKVDGTNGFMLRDNIEDPLAPGQHYSVLGGWFDPASKTLDQLNSLASAGRAGQQSIELLIARFRLASVVGDRYYKFKAMFPQIAPPADLDARRLIQAFHGIQLGLVGHSQGGAMVLVHAASTLLGLAEADVGTIVEILHLRTPMQITAVRTEFRRMIQSRLSGATSFGRELPATLRESIVSEFSDDEDLKNLFLTMLSREAGGAQPASADQVRSLFEAYEGCTNFFGIGCPDHERIFFSLLGKNTHAQNAEVMRLYDSATVVPAALSLRDTIKRAFSSKIASVLLMTLPQENFDRDVGRSWARLIHEALTMNTGGTIFTRFIPIGTDEGKLAYALGALSNDDLPKVKRAYAQLYSTELKDAIQGDTSGNLEALFDVLIEKKASVKLSRTTARVHARALMAGLGTRARGGGSTDLLLADGVGGDPCDCSSDITHNTYRPNWHTMNCNKWGESYDWCYVEGGRRCSGATKSGNSNYYWRRCGVVHSVTQSYNTHVAPRVTRAREAVTETYNTHVAPRVEQAREAVTEAYDTHVAPRVERAREVLGETADAVRALPGQALDAARELTCPECRPFLEHFANFSREDRRAIAKAYKTDTGRELKDDVSAKLGATDDFAKAIAALLR
jgi:hypothetical protein